MDRGPLTVEFVGLPGAGKTTMADRISAELEGRGWRCAGRLPLLGEDLGGLDSIGIAELPHQPVPPSLQRPDRYEGQPRVDSHLLEQRQERRAMTERGGGRAIQEYSQCIVVERIGTAVRPTRSIIAIEGHEDLPGP